MCPKREWGERQKRLGLLVTVNKGTRKADSQAHGKVSPKLGEWLGLGTDQVHRQVQEKPSSQNCRTWCLG